MKIYLLGAPNIEYFVRCGRWQGVASRGGTMYYPLWLAYATGLIEKEGHSVRFIDAIARNWAQKQIIKDANNFHPDMIVVNTDFSSLNNDIFVANALKEKTGAISVIVGPPACQFAEEILNQGVDVVARKEYDYILKDLAKSIDCGESFENIRGISYKKDGNIIHNPDRDFTTAEELDAIPFVTKVYNEHLNVKDYFLNHAFFPMVEIFTTRGSPNQCTFCSWSVNLMEIKYRSRSTENIVDEFEYIIKELPEVKEIFIEDDSFTIYKKRVFLFCEEMKRRNIKISWGCQSRANLDLETMKAMESAGCRLLDVGYESGNDQLLKNIKMGITVEQLREFTKKAKEAKLKIRADFVIGFPGETRDIVENTIKFIKEIKPDILQIAVATPMPGTEFYSFVKDKEYLLIDNLKNLLDNNGFQRCIISYPNLSNNDIQGFVDGTIKDYYFNISYVPIALKNIFGKNGSCKMKMMLKSAKIFLDCLSSGKHIAIQRHGSCKKE